MLVASLLAAPRLTFAKVGQQRLLKIGRKAVCATSNPHDEPVLGHAQLREKERIETSSVDDAVVAILRSHVEECEGLWYFFGLGEVVEGF